MNDIDFNSSNLYKSKLSDEFIEKNKDKIEWQLLSRFSVLSEKFMEKYSNEIYWYYISAMQKLSEDFIERYRDKVDWGFVSQYQKLSEEFIEKNKDYVDWCYISEYQFLSEDFIVRNKDYVSWGFIAKHQRLSREFIKKHKIKIPKDSWMYKNRKFKKDEILRTKLYELDGDFVYAYKAVRPNYYSIFNFQNLYEVGKTYTAHADYNPENETSFGLSAWTYTNAREYYDDSKILKVKIHLDDVACLVYEGHKLRCTKIQIIGEV